MSAYLDAGKMRALAVTTPHRLETLKQVPMVVESGYPGYEPRPGSMVPRAQAIALTVMRLAR